MFDDDDDDDAAAAADWGIPIAEEVLVDTGGMNAAAAAAEVILFAEADITFGSLHTEAAGEAATRAIVSGVNEVLDVGTTEVKADPERHGDGDREGAGEGGEGSTLVV